MVNPLGLGGPMKAGRRLQRHFVDVWNPSYTSNAMEHLAILLGATTRSTWASSRTTRRSTSGKVRSPNRRQAIAKLDTILEISGTRTEGHLYLTDCTALYMTWSE